MATLREYAKILREGCPHSAQLMETHLCLACGEELATLLDNILRLMLEKRIIDEQIENLKRRQMYLPTYEVFK
jgi:hypothetical protein